MFKLSILIVAVLVFCVATLLAAIGYIYSNMVLLILGTVLVIIGAFYFAFKTYRKYMKESVQK
jgi:hypothetical protein